MTLILNYLRHQVAVQVSDRRLTAGGTVSDDNSIKTTVVNCADATAILSYTGIAYVGEFEERRTDRWVVEALQSMGAPDLDIAETVERLRESVQETLALTPPHDWSRKGLTLVIAALRVDGAALSAVISNELEADGVTPRESSDSVTSAVRLVEPLEHVLEIHGAELPESLGQRLQAQIDSGILYESGFDEIETELSNVIQEAAVAASVNGLVGPDSLIVSVRRVGEYSSRCGGPNAHDSRVVMPHVVQRGCARMDIELAGVAPSPSVDIPRESWPLLDAEVSIGDGAIKVQNRGAEIWRDVRFDVNGSPPDYASLARGWVDSTGYLYRMPRLEPGQMVEIGISSFTRLPDAVSLLYGSRIDSWVMTARLPTDVVALKTWSC